MATKAIETGVDKLVSLINAQGRMSLRQASRELGVSETLVEEWADFLEEEGIISLEYKLAKLYLVPRKLTKKELEHKHKEFKGQKEGFVRRAEVMMADLDKDNVVFQKIKQDFQDLKKEIGKDLSGMRLKLSELERFERVKQGLDSEINQHQKEIVHRMEELTKQIEKEKKKYHEILLEMRDEEKLLAKRTEEALSLKEQYITIRDHIKEFRSSVKGIEKALQNEEHGIADVEGHIERLRKQAEGIQSQLLHKMSSLDELIKQKRKKEEHILQKENEILAKAHEKGRVIKAQEQAGKKTVEAFKKFFSEKKKVQSLIDAINRDHDELEGELMDLIKKAHALAATKKQVDFGKQADEVRKKFNEVVKKKQRHEAGINKLTTLLSKKKGKEKKKKGFKLFGK